jgi:[methyl-Co(III) methanol-specific corrinoid protein]:coenzyme M methyltransferase
VILHCCGPTADRIPYFAQAGFAAFHFESQVPPEVAVERTAGRLRLAGNINNPQTLLAGTPEQVRAEARRAIAAGVDIIAPECAVPLQTPLANMRAIVEACEAAPGVRRAATSR